MANFLIPEGQRRNLPMAALLNQQPASVRDVGSDFWFSPLTPIKPTAPSSYIPRQYAYQPGANLIWTPKGDEGYGYELLRAVADSWDLLRIALEMKKDEICGVEFEVRLKRDDSETEQEYKLRANSNSQLADIKAFWEKPDGFRRWRVWLRMLVEDLLVLDAMAVYAFRDRSAKVAGFMPTDATTWNRILTDQGVTPNDPESIAYQQVVYGFPAWDGTTQDVVYRIQNERTNRRYGYSRVERLLITISFGLNRQKFQISEYTSGNVPEGLLFVPSSVTPQKIRQWQSYLDSVTTGNLEKRRQLLMLPGGDDGKPTAIFPKQQLLKDELDEWLWQMVAACVGVSSQPLMKMMNRASGEEMNDASRERFLKPDVDFVCDYVTDCLAVMGLEDFELTAKSQRDADIVKQASADKMTFGISRTANELREAAGLDRMPGKNADRLGAFTPTGFVPLDPDPEDLKLMQQMKAPAPIPGGKPSGSNQSPAGKPATGQTKKKLTTADSLEKYSYGCVMIPIDPESDVGQAMKAIRYAIPDDHLMTTSNGVAREEDPHITVRYGIRNGYQNIGPYIENLAPFTLTMGKTMAFEPSDNSDGASPLVVKVIPSRRLLSINEELLNVAVFKESDFDYTPHATLAYLKPEYADLYTGDDYVDGVELPVTEMTISSADESVATARHTLSGSFEKLVTFNDNHAWAGTPEGGEGDASEVEKRAAEVSTSEEQQAIKAAVSDFFSTASVGIMDRLKRIGDLHKADDKKSDEQQAIDAATDIDWSQLPGQVQDSLQMAAFRGALAALSQVKAASAGSIVKAQQLAGEYAAARAAEMVGMKWDQSQLIPNPEAQWAISNTTRQKIQDIVTEGFADETPIATIAQKIQDAGLFSESRADTIATTEVHAAQSAAAYQAWEQTGGVQATRWVVSKLGCCDICDENAAAGPIPLGKPFPSGDLRPTAHPNCRCLLIPTKIRNS